MGIDGLGEGAEMGEGVGFADVGYLILDSRRKSTVKLSVEGGIAPLDAVTSMDADLNMYPILIPPASNTFHFCHHPQPHHSQPYHAQSIIHHQWQLPISSLLNYHLDFLDIQ